MPNPFSPLQSVLDLLIKEAEVLPASGRAITELSTPSPEEIHDREANPEVRVQSIWETDAKSLYRPVPLLPRNEKHAIRLFGMGSTRLYFLGTLLEHERSTPIQLAQIGVAVLERKIDGAVKIFENSLTYRAALVLDTKELSEDLRTTIERAMPDGYLLWNSGDTSHDEQGLERRLRGARLANRYMRNICWEMASGLERDTETVLVLGQSLGNEFTGWTNSPLIGAQRNFRQDISYQVRRETFSLYKLLAGLEAEMRTAAFPREWKGHRGKIIHWYLRIRKGFDFPLAGVLRVEMPNPGGEKVDTALIDEISRQLVAERTVAPYGSGPAWHAHLYPLHLAERVVRGQFHSEEVVKAGLRWHLPADSSGFVAHG